MPPAKRARMTGDGTEGKMAVVGAKDRAMKRVAAQLAGPRRYTP